MAYIVGTDRNQARIITASLNDLIDRDNSVRVIDTSLQHNQSPKSIGGSPQGSLAITLTRLSLAS